MNMANNDKESRKDIIQDNKDCITFRKKTMRRGKPHQQIYRPGSGPLRKSGHEMEENNVRQPHSNDYGLDYKSNKKKNDMINMENVNSVNDMDYKRRNKKPEQAIYVPKPVAQAMAERENQNTSISDKGNSTSKSMVNLSKTSNYENEHKHNKRIDNRNGNISHQNGSSERLHVYSKSKRFSANRRQGLEHLDSGGANAEGDSRSERRYGGGNRERDARQASEPRALGPVSHMNRVRDTRSVEPAGNNTTNHNYQTKIQSKPPSGRRHSTICLETGKSHKPIPNLENLAPRFRRKYLAENNIDPSTYPGVLEDTWDGNSATFQGSNNSQGGFVGNFSNSNATHVLPGTFQQQNVSYHHIDNRVTYQPPPYVPPNVPVSHHENNANPSSWSHTIPDTRVRGRGRLRPDLAENSYGGQVLRSLTPDRIMLLSPSNSRPCTPPPFAQRNKSMENVNATDNNSSRSQTPVNGNRMNPTDRSIDTSSPSDKISLDSKSQASSITPSKKSLNATREETDDAFDWSEEVELNERLEQEAMSDSMTRCSSVASLVDSVSQTQQPTSQRSRRNKRNRNNRNRSSSRNSKRDRSNDNQNRNSVSHEVDNSHNNQYNRRNKQHNELNQSREILDKDGFKVPDSRNNRRRKNSYRDRSNERRRDRRQQNDNSRHSSLDRSRRNSYNETENWREEIRLRCNAEKKMEHTSTEKTKSEQTAEKVHDLKEILDKPTPGLIVLPQSPTDRSKPPILQLPDNNRHKPMQRSKTSPNQQRTLYDPNNPNKPIIVSASNNRISNTEFIHPEPYSLETPPIVSHTTDQFGNVGPVWYDPYSDNFRSSKYAHHLLDIKKADFELQYIIKSGLLMHNWNTDVTMLRNFFRDSLEFLLIRDIKFCQTENVENHIWKVLYYNIIEIMRKSITTDAENKHQYKSIILSLIDEGTKYFERLLELLEETYKFKLDNYLGKNNMPPSKGLAFVGLALVSAQKIFLFLGDLARYKENVNETSNYGKCRQWYIKAQEINPKNGRPYNQLAVLAVYSRRKLDAVYYYMRSLMSSNPVQSAKESLKAIFEENRKKYEQTERKRREEKAKLQMKEKECTQTVPGSLRREIWIHPDSGRRLHRTTSAAQETTLDSEEEDLNLLSSLEVNKRFVTSYLHVHGKLITKIGMETFQHAALQMLREFRILLQQTPVHLSCNRFLHLLALNMFAIDSTQLKGPELEPGCRSEVQERALIVSLQMFNVILERCVDLLQSHLRQQERANTTTPSTGGQYQPLPLCQDLQVILPAVKVWCDWMLCHSSVWNPPPSCSDYKVGPSCDAWGRLATLMNLLEKLDYQKPVLENTSSDENEMVRLPEDATMCGFIPLMCNSQPSVFVRDQVDMESAQMSVRISRLLFFGTEFLCGLEPPVLKLQRYDSYSEYVSVVRTSARDSPPSPPELCNEELLLESFSEDEDEENKEESTAEGTPGEIRSLLDRKVELEKRHRTQELHRQRVQAILQQSVVSVEIEVRPKYLVPDTNCFIDYLQQLQTLIRSHGPQPPFTLMVPVVVLGELEGLTRGGKGPTPAPRVSLDPEHMLRVADAARRALDFLHCRNPAIKCLTTRGTILTSSTFTSEDDDRSQEFVGPRNDDRILATCLSLCRGHQQQQKQSPPPLSTTETQTITTEPRKIHREMVLLTDDRNLRVKALARDVPVRELPDFLQWAGLG